MTTASRVVDAAIDKSIREDRIVTLEAPYGSQEWAQLMSELAVRAENGEGTGRLHKYWKMENKYEWCVHIKGT